MATRPPELSMDAKWEAAIDHTLRRLVYGSLAGGAAGLMLFRASPSQLPSRDRNTDAFTHSRVPDPSPSDHLFLPGGAGTRSASLAFGAGAALGSAYTGTHPTGHAPCYPTRTYNSRDD